MTAPDRSGVLLVDKPRGPTSHDVVARARKSLRERRIGHTGTLDPFATGLLLLCVGPATRLSEYLTGMAKTYEATARLGVSTETLDPEGAVVSESDAWREVEAEAVDRALEGLRGEQDQVPPQYSAKKVKGVAMHRRARQGETVELEPRRITVHQLDRTGLDLPELRFRVTCSSGTYVRALARDLGEALGTGAHLTDLRRTSVGAFRVEDALSLEALEGLDAPEAPPPQLWRRAWRSPLEALAHLPRLEVSAAEADLLAQGRFLDAGERPDQEPVAVALGDELVAVAEVRGGKVRPRKVFARPGEVGA